MMSSFVMHTSIYYARMAKENASTAHFSILLLCTDKPSALCSAIDMQEITEDHAASAKEWRAT